MDAFRGKNVESQDYILKILEIVKENRRNIDSIKEYDEEILGNQIYPSSSTEIWRTNPIGLDGKKRYTTMDEIIYRAAKAIEGLDDNEEKGEEILDEEEED